MLQGWGLLLCPQEKKTGLQCELGEAQESGHKTYKIDWLHQVGSDWDKMKYKEAMIWKSKGVPVDLKSRLSSSLVIDDPSSGSVWFSFEVAHHQAFLGLSSFFAGRLYVVSAVDELRVNGVNHLNTVWMVSAVNGLCP